MLKRFNTCSYQKEHKLVIKSRTKPKLYNAEVLTYEEEFQHFCSVVRRSKNKTLWETKESFQLMYDSCWDDLKDAYYVYPLNKEIEDEIKKKFKVIEIN